MLFLFRLVIIQLSARSFWNYFYGSNKQVLFPLLAVYAATRTKQKSEEKEEEERKKENDRRKVFSSACHSTRRNNAKIKWTPPPSLCTCIYLQLERNTLIPLLSPFLSSFFFPVGLYKGKEKRINCFLLQLLDTHANLFFADSTFLQHVCVCLVEKITILVALGKSALTASTVSSFWSRTYFSFFFVQVR